MGFFGKDRHGTMHTIRKGYKFVWEIPNIKKYNGGPNTVLDSDNVDSFSGVEFHFHMTINTKGEMGFYLHYKGPPIPKYSYYFSAKASPTEPPVSWFPPAGTSATRTSRQFTAHTIPQDTERCGHWNVLNPEQLDDLIEGTDGTLMVIFQFDDDLVQQTPYGGDVKLLWQIPRFRQLMCSPFTSRSITVDVHNFVLRLDRKGADGDFFGFVFSRSVNLPPMAMRIITQHGHLLGSAERPAEGQPLPPVSLTREWVVQYVQPEDPLFVELLVFKSGNPLDQLNFGGKFESVMATPANQNVRTTQVGKQQYAVMADDL